MHVPLLSLLLLCTAPTARTFLGPAQTATSILPLRVCTAPRLQYRRTAAGRLPVRMSEADPAPESQADDTDDTASDAPTEVDDLRGKIAGLQTLVNGLQSEVKMLQKEADTDPQEKYMRQAAEFENSRRRNAVLVEGEKEITTAKILRQLLLLLDGFETTNENLKPEGEEAQKIQGSYLAIYKQLQKAIEEDFQPTAIAVVAGDKMDNSRHDVSREQSSDTVGAGLIMEVLAEGVAVGKQVVKKASVVVSSGPEMAAPEPEAAEEAAPEAEEAEGVEVA